MGIFTPKVMRGWKADLKFETGKSRNALTSIFLRLNSPQALDELPIMAVLVPSI